jgi:hypothetical protein
MEELDDLKSIWRQQKSFEPKDEAELARMIKGGSNTLVSKLKRNVWFELVFTLVCLGALGAYSLSLEAGALMWTILALLVLLFSYSFYYIKKIILLNQYNPVDENLKDNLSHLVERLDTYMKFYKRSYIILYPVFFALGLLFGVLERGADHFIHKFENPIYSLSFALLAIVFMVGVYTITNWFLKKLYGNYIEKLKSLLAELQS